MYKETERENMVLQPFRYVNYRIRLLMKSKYKSIFKPLKINNMILKNRVFASSGISASSYHSMGDAKAAGEASLGGVSMVITCMTDIDCKKSNFYPNSVYTLSKLQRDNIRSNVKKIHQGGAKYIIELDHVGEYYRAVEGDFSWGTVNKVNEKGIVVKAIHEDAMQEVVDAYAKTAVDAKELGFDGVLFDCASGWLMSQFISTHYNKRTDEYGGSIENRAKFPKMVVQAMRNSLGTNYPILCQISANEYFEDGTPFEDLIIFLKIIEPYIDGVLVICGNDQTRYQMTKLVSTNLEPFLLNLEYTEKLKKYFKLPIALLNGVATPEQIDYVLSNNKADLIGLSRPLIADPNFVNKILNNLEKDITPCLRCNQCFHVSTEYKNIGCSVNPYYTQGDTAFLSPIKQCKTRKNVVIVGAGPAGLRAALAADKCGHKVTLIDKSNDIGGLLKVISKEHFKEEIKRYLEYLRIQIEKSNVKLILNTLANKELVQNLHPDRIIIAIGGEEVIPNIAGIENENVFTAKESIIHPEKLGNKIAIVGGGTVGVEIAIGLAIKENKEIYIIEIGNTLAKSANLIYRPALLERVNKANNIHVMLKTVCVKINENSIVVKSECDDELIVDSVIISTGIRPKTKEAYDFYGIIEDTIMIGDANKTGNIIDATFDGHASGVNS